MSDWIGGTKPYFFEVLMPLIQWLTKQLVFCGEDSMKEYDKMLAGEYHFPLQGRGCRSAYDGVTRKS